MTPCYQHGSLALSHRSLLQPAGKPHPLQPRCQQAPAVALLHQCRPLSPFSALNTRCKHAGQAAAGNSACNRRGWRLHASHARIAATVTAASGCEAVGPAVASHGTTVSAPAAGIRPVASTWLPASLLSGAAPCSTHHSGGRRAVSAAVAVHMPLKCGLGRRGAVTVCCGVSASAAGVASVSSRGAGGGDGSGGIYRAAVGIDLGTTTSAVAVAGPDGRPTVVEDEAGRAVIPSVVFVQKGGRVLVGQEAAAAAESDPSNAFYGVKRLMGRSYREALAEADDEPGGSDASSPSTSAATAAGASTSSLPSSDAGMGGGPGLGRQGQRQRLGGLRSYGLVEGRGGGVELVCPALGRTLTPPEVSAHLLRHLADRAAAFLERRRAEEGQGGGVQVLDAVVTVPANYTPAQRAAVVAAAREAGLQRVTLLQEPIAAALAYGFGSPHVPYDVLLVFDLGGGTLDLTIVEAFEGIMEVLATSGDNRLGGDDFTAALADWLAAAARGRPPPQAAQGPQGPQGSGPGAQGPSRQGQMRGEAGQAAQRAEQGAGPSPLALFLASERAKLALSRAAAEGAAGAAGDGDGGSARVSVRVRLPAGDGDGDGGGSGGGGGGDVGDVREVEVEVTQEAFQELVGPLMRRLWWPLERLATVTRTQLGGRLPPELDPRRAAADASPDELTHRSSITPATAAPAGGAAAAASAAASSDRSSTGSSRNLADEGPGRRDGAAAWEFSVFPPEPEASAPDRATASASGAAQPKYVAPPRRLTGLVLVGAATRLPVIRDYITQVTGLPVRPGVDPETAVALGAALHAGLMVGAVAGGIEMNDGGYVAEQHGRTQGFQADASLGSAAEDGLVWEP